MIRRLYHRVRRWIEGGPMYTIGDDEARTTREYVIGEEKQYATNYDALGYFVRDIVPEEDPYGEMRIFLGSIPNHDADNVWYWLVLGEIHEQCHWANECNVTGDHSDDWNDVISAQLEYVHDDELEVSDRA